MWDPEDVGFVVLGTLQVDFPVSLSAKPSFKLLEAAVRFSMVVDAVESWLWNPEDDGWLVLERLPVDFSVSFPASAEFFVVGAVILGSSACE